MADREIIYRRTISIVVCLMAGMICTKSQIINSTGALNLFTGFAEEFGVPLEPLHPLHWVKWTPDPADYNDTWEELPMPDNVVDCELRPKHFTFGNHSYFYSKSNTLYGLKNHYGARLPNNNWFQAFETCRKYCMSPVSIETEDEWLMIEKFINKHKFQFTWTSGRRCTYDWCMDLPDIEPNIYNGWVWFGSGKRLSPANAPPINPNGSVWSRQPWLERGENSKIPQPDNAEFHRVSSRQPELCLGIIYRVYEVAQVGLHDISCQEPKYVLCEDDDALLREANLIP